MRTIVGVLLLFLFFLAQHEVCSQVNEGNVFFVKPALLASHAVTGAIDAATRGSQYETHWSDNPSPWIGISTVSLLIMLTALTYGKGYFDREAEYVSQHK
jgi:hypothetical protein